MASIGFGRRGRLERLGELELDDQGGIDEVHGPVAVDEHGGPGAWRAQEEFAVVGEQLGLVGVLLVLMAFCAFGYAGIRLAIGCRDPFAKRLAAGITALVCGQASRR